MDYTKYVLKDSEELKTLLEGKDNLFVIGCNKCFKAFDTLAEPETENFAEFAASLGKNVIGKVSIDFLCNGVQTEKAIGELIPQDAQNVIVVSCGLGIQTVAKDTKLPVYSATNSLNYIGYHGMALTKKTCDACNQCYLNITGGICPITDCTKSLVNGPCGGAKNGKCEIDPKKDCAWVRIIDRLEKQGRKCDFLDNKVELRDYSKVNFKLVNDYVDSIRESRFEGFYGGIHPIERKELTENIAPVRFPDPEIVVIPTSMHAGAPATPIVAVGDKVKLGQEIAKANGFISCNVHSSVSGTVEAIEERFTSRGKVVCIVIKSDGKNDIDDSVKPAKPLSELTPDEIVEVAKEKGLAGMGGAGFPTYVKLKPGKPIDAVLINGSECEPLITADHRVFLDYSDDVIYGLRAAMKAVSAPKGYIVIENNKQNAIDILSEKLKDAEDIEVVSVKTKYPEGAEKMMIKRVLGKMVPSGGLPADVGAVVLNASTAKALSDALLKGMPCVERIVTVSGEKIAHPGNYIVKLGTDVSDILDYCGGVEDGCTVKMGGPMMGTVLNNTEVPVIKGTNGIIAVETEHNMDVDCIKCGRCVDVCPMELKPIYFQKFAQAKDAQGFKDYKVMDCIECGCCQFYCAGKSSIVDIIRQGKALVRGMK